MAVTADAPVSKVEGIKFTSDHLRGTIAEELAGDAPAFSSDSYELLKFHGIYQQDDRDVRAERKRQGLDVDHICMVRVSIPGGILNAEQYLSMDKLCDAVGNGTADHQPSRDPVPGDRYKAGEVTRRGRRSGRWCVGASGGCRGRVGRRGRGCGLGASGARQGVTSASAAS